MTALPAYLALKPDRYSVRDVVAFCSSPHAAKIDKPAEDIDQYDTSKFASIGLSLEDVYILSYARSRTSDRICPRKECRRWYRVGEDIGLSAEQRTSFEAFLARPYPPVERNNALHAEQQLSGICSRHCAQIMMGGLDLVGKDASQMSDSDFAALSAMTNTTMRRPTEQERAEHPGAQIMAIPKDAQPDWEFQSL